MPKTLPAILQENKVFRVGTGWEVMNAANLGDSKLRLLKIRVLD